MTKVLVPLADGCEEMEAVIIIDVLRRAGWDVTSVGIRPGAVTASRGVRLVPDTTWDEVEPQAFDLLVVPGGSGGTENLCKDQRVLEAVRQFRDAGKPLAAVCAGPLVLQEAGVLGGHRVTCHPSSAKKLTATERLDDIVVSDGNIVTSQGPGTTFDFALALVERIDGAEKADEIRQAMCLPTTGRASSGGSIGR